MLRNILNGASKTITSAAIVIGAASLASRILGVVRDRVLASIFGAGIDLDMYYAAFRIPDMLFNLVVLGALSAGFIPLFSELYDTNKARAWKFASNTLNILVAGLVVVCAVLFILAPWLTRVLTPGFSEEAQNITTQLTRIMFLSPLLMGVSSLFGGILQSFKRFFIFSLAPIVYNVGIIIGAFLFVPYAGVYGLAYGVALGALLHLLVQVPTASFLGFSYKWIWKPFDKDFKEVLKLMVPRTLSLGVQQINIFVITIIASLLAVGSLTIYTFAFNIQSFIIGVFGISFAIAAFPTLCDLAREKTPEKFVDSLTNTTRQILFFVIPLSALFIILRAQIVRVILGGGAFDWAATITTADTLAIFALSLVAQSIIPLYSRAFFAYKDSRTPFVHACFAAVLNCGLALYMTFETSMGVVGLAWAFTISAFLQLLLLFISLRKKVGGLRVKVLAHSVGKILLATLVGGTVTQFMKSGVESYFGTDTFLGIFLQGFISGIVGLAVFTVVGIALNIEELTTFLASAKRKLLREKVGLAEEEGIDGTVDQ